jgi:hypothetical protein
VTGTAIDLAALSLPGGTHSIRIRAMRNTLQAPLSEGTNFMAQLDRPTGVTINASGVLSWNAVTNATHYQVSVNNGVNWSANQTGRTYDLHNHTPFLQADVNHQIRVRAVTSSIQSPQSDPAVTFRRTTLGAPTIPTLNTSIGVLTWNQITNANGYQIHIGGVLRHTITSGTTTTFNLTTLSPQLGAGNHEIRVLATANSTHYVNGQTFMNSPLSPIREHTITRLSTINIIQQSINTQGVLTWAHIPNAASYQVQIGSTNHNVPLPPTGQDPSFNLLAPGLNLAVGVTHNIIVRSLATDFRFTTSLNSATITFTRRQLQAPTNIRIENEILLWNSQNTSLGAADFIYQVSLDNGATWPYVVPNEPPFQLNLTLAGLNVGNHQVRIRAFGDGVFFISSAASSPVTYRGRAQVNANFTGTADARVIYQGGGIVGASLSTEASATSGIVLEFEVRSSVHMIIQIAINGTLINLSHEAPTIGTIPNVAWYHLSYINIANTARRVVRVEIRDIHQQTINISALLVLWEAPPGWHVPRPPIDDDGQIICDPRWP